MLRKLAGYHSTTSNPLNPPPLISSASIRLVAVVRVVAAVAVRQLHRAVDLCLQISDPVAEINVRFGGISYVSL